MTLSAPTLIVPRCSGAMPGARTIRLSLPVPTVLSPGDSVVPPRERKPAVIGTQRFFDFRAPCLDLRLVTGIDGSMRERQRDGRCEDAGDDA